MYLFYFFQGRSIKYCSFHRSPNGLDFFFHPPHRSYKAEASPFLSFSFRTAHDTSPLLEILELRHAESIPGILLRAPRLINIAPFARRQASRICVNFIKKKTLYIKTLKVAFCIELCTCAKSLYVGGGPGGIGAIKPVCGVCIYMCV